MDDLDLVPEAEIEPRPKRHKRRPTEDRKAPLGVAPWYEEPLPPPIPTRGTPECTDTGGEVIPRVSATSIQAILDDPSNGTEDGPCDYALVYCLTLGIGIIRDGVDLETARFVLFTVNNKETEFWGSSGRDEAIRLFVRYLRAKQSFH